MLYRRTLFILPIYTSLHLLIPNSQSFPPPSAIRLGKHKSVLYVCESVSALQKCSFVLNFGGSSVAKSCSTLVTPWTVACQAPLSMGFSRQEYWSGLPFPSLGDLPNPGIKPGLPHWWQSLYQLSYEGSPCFIF